MNTHEIGDLYENQFAEYLRSLVNDGKFPGTTPGLSQVYQKKKYTNPFGLSTESDITIENKFSPNDKDYSSLIVFECKYHGETRKNLNRDLFHSFSDKINTYYGGGCKGFLVTSKGFSKSTIELAKIFHIGLLRFDPETLNLSVVAPRKIKDYYSENESNFAILFGEKPCCHPILYWEGRFHHIEDFLYDQHFNLNRILFPNIPYLSLIEIKNVANKVWKDSKFDGMNLSIEEKAMRHFGITEVQHNVKMESGELGRYFFKDNRIELSDQLIENQPRTRFTIAHEIGHSALHRDILEGIVYSTTETDDFDVAYECGELFIPRMEYQANVFASYLLMQEYQFDKKVKELFKKYDIRRGRLYLDNQFCNRKDCKAIIGNLALHFGVSQQAVKFRLISENLIEIHYNVKSIGQILMEQGDNFFSF